MKTIWKFELPPGVTEIYVPAEADVLTVREQSKNVCVWMLFDPDSERKLRKFVVYGTGWALPDNPGRYVGTAIVAQGALVWHVFEV